MTNFLSPGQTDSQVEASWKLGSTCDSVWPGVAWTLRWLAMTCANFGRDQICTQVKASFSPFRHPTQVNASWVTSINGLLANEIQDMSALKWVFCDSRVLVRKLASPFGHPTPSLYSSSTWGHLRVLASPFGQRFNSFRFTSKNQAVC